MDHWWDDTDRGKLKYLEKNLSHCYFDQHQSHKHWPWSEPRPMQSEAAKTDIYKTELP